MNQGEKNQALCSSYVLAMERLFIASKERQATFAQVAVHPYDFASPETSTILFRQSNHPKINQTICYTPSHRRVAISHNVLMIGAENGQHSSKFSSRIGNHPNETPSRK
jgi:hypothetical protein